MDKINLDRFVAPFDSKDMDFAKFTISDEGQGESMKDPFYSL